jgi:hypothetical protein
MKKNCKKKGVSFCVILINRDTRDRNCEFLLTCFLKPKESWMRTMLAAESRCSFNPPVFTKEKKEI